MVFKVRFLFGNRIKVVQGDILGNLRERAVFESWSIPWLFYKKELTEMNEDVENKAKCVKCEWL